MVCQGLDGRRGEGGVAALLRLGKRAPQDYAVVDRLRAGAGAARHWWDVGAQRIHDPRLASRRAEDHGWWQGDQDQVGTFLHGYDSLWLPASLLRPSSGNDWQTRCSPRAATKRQSCISTRDWRARQWRPIAAAKDTATNPAVTEAFALAIIADGEMPAYPGLARPPMDVAAAHKDAKSIDLATAELHKIAPDAGSYVSESNYFNAHWQPAYWGANYPRLRAVKEKYDPGGLFFVHHGVGSEGWNADGFTQIAG